MRRYGCGCEGLCGLAALLILPAIVAGQPSPLMTEYNRAFRLLSQWKPDDAIPILDAIVAKDGSFYRAYDGLLEAYRQKKDLPAAEQYFKSLEQRAITLPPFYLLGQAKILLAQNRESEAETT